jgi:6,7-dimethyl-8-ribityllumazine synthase
MSDFQLPPKPRILGKKSRVAIVASRFNSAYSDALVESALAELMKIMPEAVIDLHQVPGAFEVPFAVEYLASRTPPDVIIALGVVIRGATAHADLVGDAVTRALMETATKHLVPVIHEVLLLDDQEQAKERTMGTTLNRGREAARTASMMLSAVEKLRKTKHVPGARGLAAAANS